MTDTVDDAGNEPGEPFVVTINAAGQQAHRRFWGGPVGSALLLVPGVVILVVAVILVARQLSSGESSGSIWFFAAVVALSGAYALHVGWDQRRRTLAASERPPLAFVLDDEGVFFPRNKRFTWEQARFVVTAEEEPRLLCSPVGLAFRVDELGRSMPEIELAVSEISGGRVEVETLTP